MNKSTKWTAAAVVMSLLVTAAPMITANAETTQQTAAMSQEQAMKAAQKHVAIPSTYKLESARLSEGEPMRGGLSIWEFSWTSDEFAEKGTLHVQVDARTGELIGFRDWDYGSQQPQEAKVTRAEAQATAETYIRKHQAKKFAQVQYIETQNLNELEKGDPKSYAFRYVRMVNGIPFPQDGFFLTINNQGEVREFNYTWTAEDSAFPKTDGVLKQDEANAAYLKNLPLDMQYQVVHEDNDKQTARLFYTPTLTHDRYYGYQANLMLDAQSGDFITRTGTKPDATSAFELLADKPGPAPVQGEVTKELAIKQAEQYLNLTGYTLTDSEFMNWGQQHKVWRLSYYGDSNHMYTEVMINGHTGELVRFYTYSDRGQTQHSENPKYTFEQAKTKAVEYLKKAVPTQLHTLTLVTKEDSLTQLRKRSQGYTFEFKQVVNGILVESSYVTVSVNPDTGEILQVDNNLPIRVNQDLNYPDPKSAMALDQAKGLYLKRFPVQLQYVRLYKETADTNPMNKGPQPGELRLVYMPLGIDPEWGKLEANSGVWYGPWGGKLWVKKSVADISGHWAENELQFLADREILPLDDSNKLHPNTAITRGDAVRVLLMTRLPNHGYETKNDGAGHYQDVPKDDPNYKYIERAVLMGWFPKDLANFRPNDPLTREELAEMAVKSMNYGELAAKENVFIKPFADLDADEDRYLGSIAIMKAFGIMKGDGTNFHPDNTVSKAEIAVVADRIQKEMEKRGQTYYY